MVEGDHPIKIERGAAVEKSVRATLRVGAMEGTYIGT